MTAATEPAVAVIEGAEPRGPSARTPAVLGALLIVLVFSVFLPATRHDFVNYDDPVYVTANPHVQGGPTWANLKWALTTGHAGNWHPLTWLSHQLDWRLHGPSAAGHHLSSILLHALNTLLVFFALRAMTGAIGRSFAVAALFGLHPLRVESVAWVAERKDVLSGTFFMLLLLGYTAYVRHGAWRVRRSRLYYGLTVAAFACGLLSKPILVTVPFVLLLLDAWPLNRLAPPASRAAAATPTSEWKTLLFEKAPFFALAAISAAVTFRVQQNAGTVFESLPFLARAENALVSYCRYLGKLAWPVDLAVYYPHVAHWPALTVAGCAFAIAAISAAVVLRWRRHPFLAVGWFWYLGVLVPVIGVVQVGSQSIADRYTYLSTLGVLIGLVWWLHAMASRNRSATIVGVAVVGVAGVACATVARQQLRHWKDSETLFRHALAATTPNTVALNNLARALGEKGRLDESAAQYRAALELDPNNAFAASGLGVIAMKRHEDEAALGYFQGALRHDPNDAITHYDLGLVLARKGSIDDAIAQFEAAIRLQPDNPEARNNLASMLLRQERFDEAIPHYRRAIDLRPSFAKARHGLGLALAGRGQFDEAIVQFRAALTSQPDFAAAQEGLRMALEMKASAAATTNAASAP